jgi:predicted TIM-barrel fold metal-dependent hydrolase
LSKRLWPFTWPHQGAILENNVPFQISNGPQLWLVKLHASLCIDKYHFLDLYGLCNMKKQIVKPRHPN